MINQLIENLDYRISEMNSKDKHHKQIHKELKNERLKN